MNPHSANLINRPSGQNGLSLVETLIAISIGLVLAIGVGNVYAAFRQSHRMQDAESQVLTGGRFASEYIAQMVRMAGYKTNPWDLTATVFPPNVPTAAMTPKFGSGQTVSGLFGSAGAASSSMIGVRFQGQTGTIQDCMGDNLNDNQIAEITLSVDTNTSQLKCSATNVTAATTDKTDAVIDGIGNLTLTYGEDLNGDQVVDQYRAANAVSQWANVLSVQVDFDLRSDSDNVIATPATYSFNGTSYTDRRLVRHFSNTIAMRNYLP